MREQEVIAKLIRGQIIVPPLEISWQEGTERLASGRRVDWFLRIGWEGRSRRYAVEYKSRGTPRYLAEARAQIQALVRELPEALPMVMAPYLSEDKLTEFAEAGVSAMDLCGNAVVIAPDAWSVYRTGFRNLYPEKSAIKKIFSGTSGLVCRALLERRRFRQLSDIQQYVQDAGGTVSLGTVSKVMTSLQDDLIVSKRDGLEVTQPVMLLTRLADNYREPQVVRRLRGSFDTEADVLRTSTAWAARTGALLAVSGETRYAATTSSDAYPVIYTNRAEEFVCELGFEEDIRFADAEIRSTDDPQVYFDLNRIDGVPWQSELQTYLELMQGGKRERDLAASLRDRILDARP